MLGYNSLKLNKKNWKKNMSDQLLKYYKDTNSHLWEIAKFSLKKIICHQNIFTLFKLFKLNDSRFNL